MLKNVLLRVIVGVYLYILDRAGKIQSSQNTIQYNTIQLKLVQ